MKQLLLILPIYLTLLSGLKGQNDCPCCSELHKQFDFWVGDWIVYDTLGTQLGENTISSLEDHCILSEHWRGSKGLTGRSFNYFNPLDSSWNQLWIDNTGSNLKLKGKGGFERMVLRSELTIGRNGEIYRNRISWVKQANGNVHQIWDIVDANDSLLRTVFFGVYKKRKK